MSLTELISGVEAHEMTLTVFNADSDAAADLRERFADRNLTVEAADATDGPREYVVLSKDDEFLTAVGLEEVLNPRRDTEPHFEGARTTILDHLDETMFTSYDIEQMVSASREIEDRAWRIGAGEIHSGFQNVSIIDSQMDVYEQLGSKENLSVHAYGYPDTELPSHDGFVIHAERAEEIAKSWFVVYDGAGVDSNKCALLAEERGDREFYGFWTYDPSTVDWIVDHLTSTYGLIQTDGGSDP
ncbi:DICT sensory domain-containing protein [Halomarina rubra]|uniref:DICT sensory domain-containing protein n=1 Tax=Halomarina rubra TaxID=2071873 RepID=A0ABD6ASJ6_9EURY|nr:DICT sensory domain-containing protein [Halomarina rubra]